MYRQPNEDDNCQSQIYFVSKSIITASISLILMPFCAIYSQLSFNMHTPPVPKYNSIHRKFTLITGHVPLWLQHRHSFMMQDREAEVPREIRTCSHIKFFRPKACLSSRGRPREFNILCTLSLQRLQVTLIFSSIIIIQFRVTFLSDNIFQYFISEERREQKPQHYVRN